MSRGYSNSANITPNSHTVAVSNNKESDSMKADLLQILSKGQGRGIMVSDFIDEHNGYLRLSDAEYKQAHSSHPGLWKEVRFLLKYGASTEGYWKSEKFMKQVEHAVTIAEIKYPRSSHNLLFLFDQSSGHTAFADDALNVNRMNVNPGGTQPKMRDTI